MCNKHSAMCQQFIMISRLPARDTSIFRPIWSRSIRWLTEWKSITEGVTKPCWGADLSANFHCSVELWIALVEWSWPLVLLSHRSSRQAALDAQRDQPWLKGWYGNIKDAHGLRKCRETRTYLLHGHWLSSVVEVAILVSKSDNRKAE